MLRLTLERQKRNWTKQQLGFEAKIHPSIIGKLESEKIFPYKPWKDKISNVLGIPEDELFEEVDSIEKSIN